MKGLLFDRYYKIVGGIKMLLTVLLVSGIFIITFIDSQLIMQGYIVVIFLSVSIYLLSVNHNDIGVGWQKYELILPVERSTIIRSKYLIAILGIILETFLALIYLYGSFIMKGTVYFDLGTKDILTIFVTIISLTMQIFSWYYLLWYLIDAEKKELVSIISVLISICTIGTLIWFLNTIDLTVEKSWIIIFFVSILIMFLSYQITKRIYEKKEY